jgi:signal transduction histidine kinase
MIYGDEYCINEAINNILHNAVKYTEEGSVNMSLQDSIHSTYKLIIEDTGIGMSIEYQKKLFETFSQESDGYSKKYQGIGLGLALTKKFLEMNDIEIDIQSERQKGTTITLIFPKYQHNRSRINGIKKGLVEVAGCIL